MGGRHLEKAVLAGLATIALGCLSVAALQWYDLNNSVQIGCISDGPVDPSHPRCVQDVPNPWPWLVLGVLMTFALLAATARFRRQA